MAALYRIGFHVEQESDVVPDSVFNRLIQRPSRGLGLRGRLRWLKGDDHDVLIEGPRDDVERYLEYLRVGEPIIGEISMVNRQYITFYGLKEDFFYLNINLKARARKRSAGGAKEGITPGEEAGSNEAPKEKKSKIGSGN